jgi:hypothetical protein
MLLAKTTTHNAFIEWTSMYGVTSVFFMPIIGNFSNPVEVANALKLDLLKEFKSAKLENVMGWQGYINKQMSDMDKESSNWAHLKLKASTVSSLQVQVQQSMEEYAEYQRGGVLFWFFLATTLDTSDKENKMLVVAYLEDHKLTDTPNEDVSISASCFKAAARSLKHCDMPSDLVELFLKSMKTSTVEKFRDVVTAISGVHEISFNDESPAVQLRQLEVYSTKLVSKYRTYLKLKEWVPASSNNGGYKAMVHDKRRQIKGGARDSTTDTKSGTKPLPEGYFWPSKEWQEWFDRCICNKCKKNHPSRSHDDVGARNRPYKPNFRSKRNNRPTKDESRSKPSSRVLRPKRSLNVVLIMLGWSASSRTICWQM